MAMGRSVKRVVLVTILVFAGGMAAVFAKSIAGFCENIYPGDPAKRQALDLCFMQNHRFNRLDAAERDACYQRTLMRPTAAAAMEMLTPVQIEPNAVDMRRAAVAGPLPRNDVRRLEQTDDALRHAH
jgi:hypothetical protein